MTASSQTKIYEFDGVVIVYNPPQVEIAVSKNLHMAFFNSQYSLTDNNNDKVDLKSVTSNFGPNYDNKCILGIRRFKHKTSDRAFL